MFPYPIIRTLSDNTSVYLKKKKEMTLSETMFYRRELPHPSARCENRWQCIFSLAAHTKDIFQRFSAMLQRWNGQAWPVTLNQPWMHSPARGALSGNISLPRFSWDVKANAHLASVASTQHELPHLRLSVCPKSSCSFLLRFCLPLHNVKTLSH